MMSSESMPNRINAVFPHKMPLFDGTIASKGLSKPQNMSDLLGKQPLQYSGSYFAYDGRGKDRAQFTPPWSHSKASPLDGRSPVSHLSGMEGQNHVIYRQDSNSSEESHSLSSSLPHAPVKQGFTIYTKSPEISSPTAAVPVAIRRQKSGGDNSSPPSENSVYLAIPKPMYGHNPCCNELCCVMGQRYSVEHGSPRLSSAVYEHNWMQSESHYTDRPSALRKAPEALLQQRGLQFEPSVETLKRIPVETYSQARARTLPAMMEPNYSGYPCTPMTRALFEQCQRLQTPPRGYPSLYPSHPTYEHVTSEVYQEHSPMSKYGQLPQHPVFYYPQENVEVENRTQCNDVGSKRREDVPVILKHTISNPRQHYVVPQSRQGEIPLPLVSSEKLSHHPLIRAFEYPCYAVPRFPLDASQIRSPLKRQHASPSLPPNHVPPSSQYVDCHIGSSNHLHQDKHAARLHVNQPPSASPFLRLDQTNPARRASQSGAVAASVHVNRYFPAIPSMYRDRPVPLAAGLSKDRHPDYTSCEAQVHSQKWPKGLLVSPTALLPQSPVQVHTAAPDTANARKIIYSPTVAPGTPLDSHVSSTGNIVPNGSLKRSISHSSASVRVKEEDRDYCEVELKRKRQKTEMDGGREGNKPDSPPMPVIDNVFSLAPYQTYLQASGVLFPGRVPHKPVQSSEHFEGKTKTDIKEKRPERDEPRPAVCQVSKEISASSPAVKPAPETFELKNIKVEKEDPPDNTDNCAEPPVSQKDCTKVAIKTEPEETASPTCEHMLVIKKYEPDELDSKPHLMAENEVSDESKPGETTADTNTSTCTPPDQTVTPQYEPISPPQPPEPRLDFKNIPAHCLKLPPYKFILCNTNQPKPVAPPEMPPAPPPPAAGCQQRQEPQTPVRKHFLELHQSLHKLVSKSVAASSEQQLKAWLSKLDLSEPVSPTTKVQKVSCLLGAKAREAWITEEIKVALQALLERLTEYRRQERCPFPHVMRTGAVFLPMLVVKELLFPMVQGTFIDQVLQEHRVELRPTTLSEEKILIQLHKRACSSRLRRLMSLKHLPQVYADTINLLYYTCVCKHLGLDTEEPVVREKDEGCEEPPALRDTTTSSASPAESQSQKRPTNQDTKAALSRSRTKSRVKSSSRRLFLDSSLSEDEAEAAGRRPDALGSKQHSQPEAAENGESEKMDSEQDPPLIPPSTMSETSWMCPLTSGDLSPSPSDPETNLSSGSRLKSSGEGESQCSGVILKLRRMFSKGLNRKKARYQAVSVLETLADAPTSQTDGGEGEASGKLEPPRRSKPHRWQRTGGFSQALRPLSGSSKRNHRSLLKIKYCPYLSACHSAEHRRRWVLRSAVQRAQRAMRFYYPDLVGKRIRHLYEEDDKSEVWYRGEVLRVHEAHANPLKTIFEVRYDSEPEWKYYLELLIDYKKGWLKIEDEHRE